MSYLEEQYSEHMAKLERELYELQREFECLPAYEDMTASTRNRALCRLTYASASVERTKEHLAEINSAADEDDAAERHAERLAEEERLAFEAADLDDMYF